MAVNDSTLTADNLLLLQGSLSLAGPLLEATNSTVTFAKSVVRVFDGGTLVTQSPAGSYPLVKLNGGSLTVGTPALAGSMFDLVGRNTFVAADASPNPITGGASTLTLGTDQPIQHQGPLLELANGATANVVGPVNPSVGSVCSVGCGAARDVGNVLALDTALLAASAPLITLSGQSTLTTNGNTIDLIGRARIDVAGAAMIRVDSSILNVLAGHVVNVAAGSRLNVAGDLIRLSGTLAQPSILNVSNGSLLQVTAAVAALTFAQIPSIVQISGALVSFSGNGPGANIINVTNTFAPTAFVNGVPVFNTGSGGTNLQITGNPLVNLGTQGTIVINGVPLAPGATGGVTGSLVVIRGNALNQCCQTGGFVKIGP
jgi:hypothetical protein